MEKQHTKKLRSLHPGEGRIEFEAFFRELEEVRYKGTFAIEHPLYVRMEQSI
ncbi:MAG: hypothetical protein IJC02_04445 [Lachnospiraceae bacterium]|nr:hypothetical protein [Lachnospiraceae bacterium]